MASAAEAKANPRALAKPARWPKLARGLRRAGELATRAMGPIPLTPLGVVVLSGCAWAFFGFGLGRLDLVLLVLGAAGLGVGAVAMLTTVVAAVLTWRWHRRTDRSGGAPGDEGEQGARSIDVECGYAVATGFWLPRLRGLPFVDIRWRWLEPEAEVRVEAQGGRLREKVLAARRGQVAKVVRELEVGDIFGLTQIRLRLTEHRKVRFVPSVGRLDRVEVVRGMAGGEDISHPEGPMEGELYDLRHYAPGDPIRFVLWKVFARTRQLVVRSPERALSPIRQTCAYLVAGPADEPAAGAARLAIERGALGSEWVLGADGSHDDATRKDQAVDLLARSATVSGTERGGRGLGEFLRRRSQGGMGRAVVFVPGRPGPWLDAVVNQCAGHDGASGRGGLRGQIEFVVGTDGIERARPRNWLARLALRERKPQLRRQAQTKAPAEDERVDTQDRVTTEELAKVVAALSKVGRVVVVDRQAGRVFAGGQLTAMAEDRRRAA